MSRNISRRTLLGAATGSLALPFLPSLVRGQDEAVFPLRLVLFYHPNGSVPDYFWPTPGANESDFELSNILTPFAPYQDRLLIAKGIHCSVGQDPMNNGGPHQRGMGALFTGQLLLEGEFKDGCGSSAGWANGPSIDQVVAKKLGQNTAFSSLELGVRANMQDVQGRISYIESGSPLPNINDPLALYDRLFYRSAPLDPADPSSRSMAILDTVKDQTRSLMQRVGQEDRQTMERHLSLVEDLERRLATSAGLCPGADAPESMVADSEDTMPAVSRAQLDLLAHALSCDLTRVASVQYSTGFNQIRYPWLDEEGEGHTLSHSGNSNTAAWEAFAGRVRWHAEEIAYFMNRLAEIPEGEGSVLDNTVILWGTEVAQGNSHSLQDIPYVLLGNAQGAINSGRYLNYGGESSCDYLRALLAALGADSPEFGHPEHTQGILSGILA